MGTAAEIGERIAIVRGRRVMLDADLSALYGVETRVLLQAVRRNIERYPEDFVFTLTNQEVAALRSQSVISKRAGRGGRSSIPLAFTEHGAIMAATMLNSPQAIQMSLFVVRAFVQMRESVARHREISRRLDQLERKVGAQDGVIVDIVRALRELTRPTEAPKRRRIGFVQD